MHHEQEIRRILQQAIGLPPERTVGEREDLGLYGMDSLNYMQVVVLLEDAFGVLIPEDRIHMRFVRTLWAMDELIEEVMHHE